MLCYLSVVFLFLEICTFSNGQTTISGAGCLASPTDPPSKWTFPNGVIFDCILKSSSSTATPLTLIVDGSLQFKQNVGDLNFPISNLEIKRGMSSQPMTASVAGNILTTGDQTFRELTLDFTSSNDQSLEAGGVIVILGDVTKTTSSALSVSTSASGSLRLGKSINIMGNLLLSAFSIQFAGALMQSGSGNIDLQGELQFTGTTAQNVRCTLGILTAINFNKVSTFSGKVTIESSPAIGGIKLTDPTRSTIDIQTAQGLLISSPITIVGNILCSGGPLEMNSVTLTGLIAGQTITSYTSITVGDIVQTNVISLTMIAGSGSGNIITGNINVQGDLFVQSPSTVQSINAASATFSGDMTIIGDITTSTKCEIDGNVIASTPGVATQTLTGGARIAITGNLLRAEGNLHMVGTHVEIGGHVRVDTGFLKVDAVGIDSHAQFTMDVTAVGITFTGPIQLFGSSLQTLDAGSGLFKIQPLPGTMSKDNGDLIIKGAQFIVTGHLVVNRGSLTISGDPTSFSTTANIQAGSDLNLPPCTLMLIGTVDQAIQATIDVSQFNSRLTGLNAIRKTGAGILNIGGTYVDLAGLVKVSAGGLTINGQVTAHGKLSATTSVDLDIGSVYGDVQGSIITINRRLDFLGTGTQRLISPDGSVTAKNIITKNQGDLIIQGPSTVSLLNDVTVAAGELQIISNSQATTGGNLAATSMILCDLMLQGSTQTITANDIEASKLTKTTSGDLTIRVSTRLKLNGLLQTSASVILDTISSTDVPTFSAKGNIMSEADVTIKYPLTFDGTSSQEIQSRGFIKCKDITKTLGGCRLAGPLGITVLGQGVTIAGTLTLEGALISDVATIEAQSVDIAGSCTLTRSTSQTVSASDFIVGKSADSGGLTKNSGDLNLVLTNQLILHGQVMVSGVFDVVGKMADISSTKVQASTINFHGFSGFINLGSTDDQILKATSGTLQMDSSLIKTTAHLTIEGPGGINIGGTFSTNAGDLFVKSHLTTSATSILTSGSAYFFDHVILTATSQCEFNIGQGAIGVPKLVIYKTITKALGDLSILNRNGDVILSGDITLDSGSLTTVGNAYVYQSITASNKIEFQKTVLLNGYGSQKLTSRNVKFAGDQPVSVTKQNGALVLGDPNDSSSGIFFSDTGVLSVWNGSLTVHGSLTMLQSVWADDDIMLDSVTFTGSSSQSIISINGCLYISGQVTKAAQYLMLGSGQDCINLGTLTEAKGGQLVRCPRGSTDPCLSSECRSSAWPGESRSQAGSCPRAPARPTPPPTPSPTVPPTSSPTQPGMTNNPTGPPTTLSPTKPGETRSPTASPTRSAITRRPTTTPGGGGDASATKKDDGLSAAAIVGIIVVVLAIPGVAILIWLCLRNKSRDTDREVLLSDDVGEYKAPNA